MKRFLILVLFAISAHAQNSIYVDQVGNNNQIMIDQSQAYNGTATISIGSVSGSDSNAVNITQDGVGVMSSTVQINSGINNSITTNQVGVGTMIATVQNLNGSANSISISQSGAANNTFNVINGAGTTNNANTVTATQSGNAGADKSFNLTLNSTNGANVTVQQTNPTQANSGSMTIQCTTCGSYSYIRN